MMADVRTGPSEHHKMLEGVASLSTLELRGMVRRLQLPPPLLRAELDTPERRASCSARVGDLDRSHVREFWRAARSSRVDISPAWASQRATLREAWARLCPQPAPHWFHTAPATWRRLGGDRTPWLREQARRVEMQPWQTDSAPIHPFAPSLVEAALFASLLPLMRACEQLGPRVVLAFDRLGQPTQMLGDWARTNSRPVSLDPVWFRRPRCEDPRRPVVFRVANYVANRVHNDTEGVVESRRARRIILPLASRLEVLLRGELAWRRAVEEDVVVGPVVAGGHVLTLSPSIVGLAYRELDDPFEPLLAMAREGVYIREFSREVITYELWPREAIEPLWPAS